MSTLLRFNSGRTEMTTNLMPNQVIRNIGRLVAAFATVALTATTALASFSCPKPLYDSSDSASGSGILSDQGYKLEYKSWAWGENSSNYICHCVRNLHQRPVFISWPDVGMSGWARLNGTAFRMSTNPNGNTESKTTILQYGKKRPGTVSVTTLFPKSATAPVADEVAKPIAFDSTGYIGQRRGEISEITTATISVPSISAIEGLTGEEIEQAVEDDPSILTDVTMTFTSKAQLNTDTERYQSISMECSYAIGNEPGQDAFGGSRNDSVRVLFDTPSIQEAIFRQSSAKEWSQWSGQRGTARALIKTGGVTAADIKSRSANMQLVSSTGEVLGSIAVRYLTAD